jgi:hypothetical protein
MAIGKIFSKIKHWRTDGWTDRRADDHRQSPHRALILRFLYKEVSDIYWWFVLVCYAAVSGEMASVSPADYCGYQDRLLVISN